MRLLFFWVWLPFILACNPTPKASEVVTQTAADTSRSLLSLSPIASEGIINTVVEISAGSIEKREVNKQSGRLSWPKEDGQLRTINYLPYPANYGMIPQTLMDEETGGDGDPLDVILLGAAQSPGSVHKSRPVAVMHLIDGGEADDKIIAVSMQSSFSEINDLAQLQNDFTGITEILSIWFKNYKGKDAIEFKGYSDADSASALVQSAIAAYQSKY